MALRYHNVYGPGMPRDTPYAGVASFFPARRATRVDPVETLRTESTRVVTPRTSTTTRGYGYSGSTSGSGTKSENKSTTGF